MHLTLRQLHIFVAVAVNGSTTAAASTISLSQSATSAALNELESLLQTPLFDRAGKRLRLNDNGRMLLPLARQILDAARTIETQFIGGEDSGGGGLHIGASTTIGTYVLPDLLAKGRMMSGSSRVTILNSSDVAKAVADFEVDVGLIEGPCREPGLQVESWLEDRLLIVCAPSHPILHGTSAGKVSKKALQEAEWVLREPGSGTRDAAADALLPHLDQLRSAGQFGSSEAVKYCAAAGLGLACLSRWVVADFLEAGRLVELHTPLPILKRRFSIVTSPHKILSVRLNRFLALCRASTN
jgi:DNA-binding transcriptional LysR family regulator